MTWHELHCAPLSVNGCKWLNVPIHPNMRSDMRDSRSLKSCNTQLAVVLQESVWSAHFLLICFSVFVWSVLDMFPFKKSHGIWQEPCSNWWFKPFISEYLVVWSNAPGVEVPLYKWRYHMRKPADVLNIIPFLQSIDLLYLYDVWYHDVTFPAVG